MQTFNQYQEFTQSLAMYNQAVVAWTDEEDLHLPYLYPVLALAEEAGEVAGKVAKYVRKSATEVPDYYALREAIGKELGDVAYQLSESARQFNFTLQDIIDMNVAKLSDRKERGVLVGEGDNR